MSLSNDKLNANRENSQKSTGPRTPEGKQRSRLNATRHGLTGQVSIPLREFAGHVPGLSRLKSRYLNGSAAWKVALANGRLVVTLQSLEANGQSPPPQRQFRSGRPQPSAR